MNMNEKHIKLL